MKFALITPSYAPDYNRCRLLCQTLDNCCQSEFVHYLIVDKRDFSLFKSLESPRRIVLTVESILPRWIVRTPFKNGWLSFKSIPLRNWIVQQLVKLSMAQVLREEILIFVDSDVFFVRSFSLQSFICSNKVRLFREPGVVSADLELANWSRVSCDLLNIPQVDFPTSNYLGNLIIWRRENVLKLHKYIEEVHGKNWLQVIANSWHLSEYSLYGTFVEHVLKQNNGHYFDRNLICHNYWHTEEMNESQIQDFFLNLPPQCFAAMISAKSGTTLETIIPYAMMDYGKAISLAPSPEKVPAK